MRDQRMNHTGKIGVLFRMLKLVKPLTGWMILAVTMGTLGFLLAQFIPVLGAYAILHGLGISIPIPVQAIWILLPIIALVRAVLRYTEQKTNHYIAFTLLAIIRDKVFKALRRLCPARLEGKDKGDLISLITSDVELLEVFYAHTISPICIAFLAELVMVVFIGSYHPLAGLVALIAYLGLGLALPVIISRRSGRLGDALRRDAGSLASFMLENIRGLDETIQYGGGRERSRQLTDKTIDLSRKQGELNKLSGTNLALANSFILVFDLIMLMTCACLYAGGAVGFDGFLIPMIALMSSFGPVTALASLGTTLQATIASGSRVLAIIDEAPQTEDIEGQELVAFAGAKVSHVTFSYGKQKSFAAERPGPGKAPVRSGKAGPQVTGQADPGQEAPGQGGIVLSDLSLDLPEKQIIGIVGQSGCGKSTLLKLLMRFWSVGKGSVSISGRNVEKINTANLRDMESYMTQETQLFKDTIAANIRIGRLDASDQEVIEACKKAAIHDFIMTLPQGYDTQVGELGETLSGGERQRIGLARAFLHDAPFMLLDEPTSNLDSLGEAIILRSLREEAAGKTVVLVSHRKTTVRIADQVIHMDQGRVSG